MKITVTYEVSGEINALTYENFWAGLQDAIHGPLRTGLDAANAQLAAENKKLRLKLVDLEVG